MDERHFNQLPWSWFHTFLLTRIHPQPLLANPSLAVHNSTHVRYPSGPGNFWFWLLTTCILALVRCCDSPNSLLECVSISCSWPEWLVFLPYSIANLTYSLSSHSGQHQSQLVTTTFCFADARCLTVRPHSVPTNTVFCCCRFASCSQHASLWGCSRVAPDWWAPSGVNSLRLA